ncbi:ferric reductase-like transmembrane domain-containing protein [Aquihabitans sp. G128]|uniref:ferric reductase-like transmembrane domain-containing protein n=1 Tax=Aquihabitans sp. G128 TaxID=2849779 RepID=UPI001C21FDDA|nr:ferric reductase-like transmembrane domain-containing protein [Aquihabitans sp. G128]QXC61003.1 ferric reductase-like transmembrane domain-containing protein [Aquihabitans sp. G128]
MTMWYVNRAAGIVAWLLLASSMLVGLLLSSRALGKKARPNWLTDLHRGLSGLAVAFVAVHVAGAIGDDYIHFGAADVLVPFASAWRPWAMAWGVVSMYLLVAVEASSLLRKHVPKKAWRAIHFASFPLFLTATTHAFTAGTDVGSAIGIGVASLASAAIAFLTVVRIRDEVAKARHVAAGGSPTGGRIPARPAHATDPATAPITVEPLAWDRPVGPPLADEPVRQGSPF